MKRNNLQRLGFSILAIMLTAFNADLFFGVPAPLTIGVLFAAGFAYGIAKNIFNFSNTNEQKLVYSQTLLMNDTTYAGEAAADFIVKAITGNDTVQNGHIYVKDGIKKKFTIPRWDADYEDFIQDVQATPTTKGQQVVSGQVLDLSEYMIYHEFNPRDYEDHWFATQLEGSTLLDTTLPTNIESVVAQEVLKRHGRFLNKLIWNGSKALTTIYKYIDGLRTKATASASTLKVGSPLTLSAVNIQAELTRGYNLIPAALKYDERMKIFVSFATYEFYMQSQINQTNKGVDVTQRGISTFRGLEVVKIPDFPDNYYMIAKGAADMSSNLWLGLNSNDDANVMQIAKKQANSELWFVKMLMKVDVQIGFNEETVTYE